MQMFRNVGALVLPISLALLLAACSLARPPAAVDPHAPAQWLAPVPISATLPHDGSVPALSAWWRRFDDAALSTLVDAAQKASPTIASAAARIAEARAAGTQAGAALLPTLDGTLSAQRSNSPFTGGSSAATGSSNALPGVTTLQAGLQSNWEIDVFGGRNAAREAAFSRLRGADAQWHNARVSVAAETANLYVGERACQRQLDVAASDAQSRSETARLTDLSAKAGFTAPASAALARASAADASARLNQQRAQCAVLRRGLVALTAIDGAALDALLAVAPVAPVAPTDRGPMSTHPLPPVDNVPARLLAQRPDVYAAETAVAAASADIGAAEADRYPRFTLQGSVAALQLRSGGVRQSLETWTIGPVALSLPIFDGGIRAANVESAKARYDEAVSLFRSSARQAVREVEVALLNLNSADAREGDAITAVDNYQASLDAAQARYRAGLGSLFELEDARRTLFAAQTARVTLQRERAEARIALYRATGGGWARSEPTETSLSKQ
ncbi:efflux transporter outer membrane subunit [Variovorax sp. RHLX14]|uniref:efflux transporter outer membrane subunit n=1 Tax=Variovorax sp. RHLX14 TaxID=1259731 RepID=UPI003F47C3E9